MTVLWLLLLRLLLNVSHSALLWDVGGLEESLCLPSVYDSLGLHLLARGREPR